MIISGESSRETRGFLGSGISGVAAYLGLEANVGKESGMFQRHTQQDFLVDCDG